MTISVDRALQDIIESVIKTPSVVEQVERQLAAWKNRGVAISNRKWEHILQQADMFEPVTDSDEPLVTGGFGYANPKEVMNKLFRAFTPPDGYLKSNRIKYAVPHYRYGMKPTGGLRLVHFDPQAYSELSPQTAIWANKWGKRLMAGIEGPERLHRQVTFDRAGMSGSMGFYYHPSLSGLKFKRDNHVPYACHVAASFKLDTRVATAESPLWSSPVVREC